MLTYYPHMLDSFSQTLKEIFKASNSYEIFGDFKPLNEIENPGFYIHVIEK